MSDVILEEKLFDPKNFAKIDEAELPTHRPVVLTVTVEIQDCNPARFRCKISSASSTSLEPLPCDRELKSPMDLDLIAGSGGKKSLAIITFKIADPTTTFVDRSKILFTGSKIAGQKIKLVRASKPEEHSGKEATLWLRVKENGVKEILDYNLHFVTKTDTGKFIEWALDPKIRNDG